MKKIMAYVLCALLLLGVCPAVRAEGDEATETEATQTAAVGIGSREEMQLLIDDPAGSFELTADIDMAGEAWKPIPFSGKLNGNGHGLYNLTIDSLGKDAVTTYDGNLIEYESVFGGLFSVLKDADVRALKLVDVVVDTQSNRPCFLGTLAGYAENSFITDCTVSARVHLMTSSVYAGVGGLVGFSQDTEIVRCDLDTELVFTDYNEERLCQEYLGGVYAAGTGRIDGCAVRTRGFAEVYGYSCNGGLIGLFRQRPNSHYASYVRNVTADTEISFFEVSDVRRAYCSSTIAEDIKRACARQQMNTIHYVRNESMVPTHLAPEQCEEPQYTFEVVPSADCFTWGYTLHTCAVCGYSYRDSYTPPEHQFVEIGGVAPTCTEDGQRFWVCAVCDQRRVETLPATGHSYEETVTEPTCTEEGQRVQVCSVCGDTVTEAIPAAGHTPGEWTVVLEPEVDVPGEEVQVCTVCGEELERREVAPLPHVYVKEIILNTDHVTLTSGQGTRLTGTVVPEDALEPELTFTSSDETVAMVLPNGRILAGQQGEAVITATSADGHASATCTVTVEFTTWQWVKYYLSFAWLGK